MKKYLFIIASLFFFINSIATPPEVLISLITNFENNNSFPWVIDESNPDNIWQIGKSYKTVFGSAYTPPNAIMTDTINFYPTNNHSSFQCLITKPENAQENCISMIRLTFHHKIDTDTLKDGGYIDISFDKGETWINIIDDTSSTSFWALGQFYENSDTLIGNRNGFSGNSTNEWISSGFEWYDENNEHARTNDSILVRFNFISDEIDNGKEGWIIDNIGLEVFDLCNVGIDNLVIQDDILFYPNPVDGISVLVLPDDTNIYTVHIFDIRGREILNCISNESFIIHRSDFDPGIYLYKISNPTTPIYTGKFIVR